MTVDTWLLLVALLVLLLLMQGVLHLPSLINYDQSLAPYLTQRRRRSSPRDSSSSSSAAPRDSPLPPPPLPEGEQPASLPNKQPAPLLDVLEKYLGPSLKISFTTGQTNLAVSKNGPFASFIYKNKRFYQDRLGTNIGTALKKGTVFPQGCPRGPWHADFPYNQKNLAHIPAPYAQATARKHTHSVYRYTYEYIGHPAHSVVRCCWLLARAGTLLAQSNAAASPRSGC